MLIRSPLFGYIRNYFLECDGTIFLFVPYIKTMVLEELLNGIQNNVVIITTWKPADILSGSSELALYLFCKKHGITLYVNDQLHLKVYSNNLEDAIIATGNVSHNGLMPNGNHEIGYKVDGLVGNDRLFFENIRKESRLVNDALYNSLMMWADADRSEIAENLTLEDIVPYIGDDDFLISSLPMTATVEDLLEGYVRNEHGMEPSDDVELSACIYHDLAQYGMEPGLSEDRFVRMLTERFFAHPFIRKIDEFIAPEAYFGRIKEWIQNNCTDVPVPSRRELTGNVQVLLGWFEKLGSGTYVIDIPGSRSQRIRNMAKIHM